MAVDIPPFPEACSVAVPRWQVKINTLARKGAYAARLSLGIAMTSA